MKKNLCIATGLFVLNVAHAQELLGVETGTGSVYAISVSDPQIEFIGSSGITNAVGFSTAADGTIYLLSRTTLYELDPETVSVTPIGALGVALFEGSLAVTPEGRAFATNGSTASNARLFEVDLGTGEADAVGEIGNGFHDVNGLVWREDGKLVGLDRVSNSLLVIDPGDAGVEQSIALPATVGGVGGIAQRNGVGYLSTSGPGGGAPGSNELFQVNLYDGNLTKLLDLDVIQGTGISGLTRGPSAATTVYCTAKTNSLGCLPSISSTGLPSASATGGFVVSAVDVRNGKLGIGCYSTRGVDVLPFQGGVLCMRPPILRTPAIVSDGSPPPVNDCSGEYAIDLNAFAAGLLGGNPAPELSVPGTQVQFQFWGRDKPASSGSSLSDALGYTVGS